MYKIQLVSIIVNSIGETTNIKKVVKEILEVMSQTEYKYEIVFIYDIDDCDAWETISLLSDIFPFIKGIKLNNSDNRTLSLNSGISLSKGDVILVLDDGTQHGPAYIPVFLAYIERGYDLVYGLSNSYYDDVFKSFFVNTTQKMVNLMTGINIKYMGANYKAYRRHLFEKDNMPENANRSVDSILVVNKETKIKEVPIKLKTKVNALSYFSKS